MITEVHEYIWKILGSIGLGMWIVAGIGLELLYTNKIGDLKNLFCFIIIAEGLTILCAVYFIVTKSKQDTVKSMVKT